MIERVSAVIPVWGEECASYLPELTAALRSEGIKEIIIAAHQGDPATRELPAGVRAVRVPAGSSVGATRNRGLAEVQTELVLFADADDLPVRGVLARLAEELTARPELIALAGRRVYMGGGLYPWPSTRDCLPRSHRSRWWRQWRSNHIPLNSGSLIRTRELVELGGWPDAPLNSDDMLACLLISSGGVELRDLPSARYRVRSGSLFHSEQNTLRRWLQTYRFQRRWLGSHQSLSRVKRWAYRAQWPVHLWSAWRMGRIARADSVDQPPRGYT